MKKLITLISLFLFFAPSICYAQKFETVCTNFSVSSEVNGKRNVNNDYANAIYYTVVDLNKNQYYMVGEDNNGTREKVNSEEYGVITSIQNGIIYIDGRLSGQYGGPWEMKYDILNNKWQSRNYYPDTGKLENVWHGDCIDTDNLLTEFIIKNSNESFSNNNYASSDELIPAASGSGFAVTSDGYVVTNYHVIEGCTDVKIHEKGESILATIVTFDPNNDIALLKGDFKPRSFYPLSRETPKLLTEIYVAGHPFGQAISTSVKVTKGIISSLSGVANNFSNLQIDAALQPGNSGGPIMNDKGNVIGVAVAKLDIKTIMEEYDTIPENVNFGVKANVVINIMESEGIPMPTPNLNTIPMSELGEIITDGTYYLSCWMTMSQINKARETKVIFKNFN